MLTFALLLALDAAPRQPVLAYWVMHHDVQPPSSAPWSEQFDLPNLVIYDDGLVLLARRGPVESVTLAEAELKPFLTEQDAFFALPDSITATNRMHPPGHLVTRWKNGARKTVRFFGALTEADERAKAPPVLLQLLERLAAFQPTKPTAWNPESLVVRACPTTAKADATWPAGWPKPKAGRAVSFLEGCFEHRLAASERATAEKLANSKNLAVVTVEKQRWLVTLVRFAFPDEDAWAGR